MNHSIAIAVGTGLAALAATAALVVSVFVYRGQTKLLAFAQDGATFHIDDRAYTIFWTLNRTLIVRDSQGKVIYLSGGSAGLPCDKCGGTGRRS